MRKNNYKTTSNSATFLSAAEKKRIIRISFYDLLLLYYFPIMINGKIQKAIIINAEYCSLTSMKQHLFIHSLVYQ